MTRPEVLAPAGGAEQLLAAVRCGADAVYLGSKGFNARRNAENFGEQSLADAVRYCHSRGVKVHVALNTLVTDNERNALIEEIERIAQSGADAVIVQDLGVAALVKQCCPTLALHASTQLSAHNVAGALLLRGLGFTRLVLARELSAGEIAAIKRESGLEMEVFVHGALCMSLSGSCYMSALLGERSGNRGLCAQPCRLNFDADGRPYALSLKDLSLIPRMRELEALGVDSLKIEGRMKRPEYVAAAVTACRQALDGEQPDMERLQAVFSRSGFTDGYFTGRRGIEMFGYRRKEDVTAAAGVLGELAGLYRGERQSIPLSMTFTARLGQPASLTATDGAQTVTAVGEPPQQAQNRPTDRELVNRSLQKLGGTPFYLDRLETELDEGVMVPVSAMNALRKETADKLFALREVVRPHLFTPPARPAPRGAVGTAQAVPPAVWLRLENAAQLTPAVERFGAERVILPLDVLVQTPALVERLGGRLAAELPMLTFPHREAQVSAQLESLKQAGLTAVTAGTQGALELARRSGLAILGDWGLNILNSDALEQYASLGVQAATLSFEGSMRDARALAAGWPCGVLGYGYLPLMTFRNCPFDDCKGCTGQRELTDRKGSKNPLLCRDKQYTQLLNALPLYLGDRQEVLTGLRFVTLYFTVEAPAEVESLLSLWRQGKPYPGQRTGGLYFRELL